MDDTGKRRPQPQLPPGESDESSPARTSFVDSYGLVLVLLVAYSFVTAIAGDSQYGRALVLVLLSATTWAALRASAAKRHISRLTLLLILLVPISGVVFGATADDRIEQLFTAALNAVLIIVAPIAIIRRLLRHPMVNAETFFGAVCVYLMIAMFFASAYSLSALIEGESFFAQDPPVVTSTDYLYFSLTTITTTGYGDLSARGQVGRLLAMTEAVLGQLYLITVVAMVVQNMGQSRRARLRPGGRGD